MNYKIPDNGNQMSAASLSSMIDIIFLLIIFFVVTASFDREQLDAKVILPEVNSGIAVKSLPPERLIVNVLADGTVKIGFYHLKANEVKSKIGPILRSMTASKHPTLILNGDGKTHHRFIVSTMEAAAAAGYNKIRINAVIKKQ